MFDIHETLLRLFAAMLCGMLIGLDRTLHGKPTGVRTLGLVSLGSALMVMASMDFSFGNGSVPADPNAVSRAIQGIITGIGFLGAGVILRDTNQHVRGLTTAASVWVTACLGIVCGLGAWKSAVIALLMIIGLLTVGGRLEKYLRQKLDKWMPMTIPEMDKDDISDKKHTL